MTTTKLCKKCGVEKPLNVFGRHSNMSDGHINTCKDCRRIYAGIWARKKYQSLSKSEKDTLYRKNKPYYNNYSKEKHKTKALKLISKCRWCSSEFNMHNTGRKKFCSEACMKKQTDYRANLSEKGKSNKHRYAIKAIEELKDVYIKALLKDNLISIQNPPIGLIELTRIQIKGKRLIKQLQ